MFEQPQKNEGGRKALVVGLGVGALVVAVIVGGVIYQSYAKKREAAARRNLEKRAKEHAARLDYKFNPYASTYVKGKVVVFNVDDKALDISQKRLPDDLRADSEEEISTLVTVRCKQELEAFYFAKKDVNAAWGKGCLVQVIDLAKNEIVGSKDVYGYAPPLQERSKSEPYEAKHPDDQIVTYLTTLPRMN